MLPFLLAVTILGRGAQNVGQTTYPLVARSLDGIGNGLLGVVAAVAGIAGVVAASTVGARITARTALWAVAAGQAVFLVAFVALAIPFLGAAGLWTGAILLGAGSGLVFPATMTAVGGGGQAGAARALSVFALALSVGLVVGPLVEAATLHLLSESLSGMFAVLIPVPALATAIAVGGAVRAGRRAAATAGDARVTEPRPATGSGRRTRQHVLEMPAFRLALAIMLAYQAPFSALLAYGGLLAHHVDGATPAGVELGFAAFYTVSFGVRTAIVRFAPVRRIRLALIVSVIFTVAGLGLLGAGEGFGIFIVAMAVLGLPHGATLPFASSILAERVAPDDLGRANARLMAATNAGAVVVPLACGWLAQSVGYRSTFLLIEVPVLAFASLLAVELVRQRPVGTARQS